MKRHTWWLRGGLVALAYALLVAPRLQMPLLGDETPFASEAELPFGQRPPVGGHPPFYMLCLRFMVSVLQLHGEDLRWLGVLCLLVSAALLWQVSERWQRGAGRWCVVLLLTNPLAVQGALLLDIDNTLLVAWTALFIWWLDRHPLPLNGRARMEAGVLWFLGLWAKCTTPLLVPPLLWWLYVQRGEPRRGLRDVTQICLLGGALFLAAWGWYSQRAGIPFWWFATGRLASVLLGGHQHLTLSILQDLAQRCVRVILQITPYAIALWWWASWHGVQRWRHLRRPDAEAFALLLSWGLFLGYLMIQGLILGFARYHAPLIPLMALLCGVAIQRMVGTSRMPWTLLGVTVAGAAFYTWFIVGDMVYVMNQSLREALIFTPARVPLVLRQLAWRSAALVLLGLLMGGVLRRWCTGVISGSRFAVLGLTVTLAALGGQMGVAAMQLTAPYATHYHYGRPWATYQATIRFLTQFHQAHPTAKLLVPFDTYYHAVGLYFHPFTPAEETDYVPWEGHDTPATVTAKIQRVDCVIVDPDFNYSHTLRVVLPDHGVQSALAQQFTRHSLGKATVWVRRGLSSSDLWGPE